MQSSARLDPWVLGTPLTEASRRVRQAAGAQCQPFGVELIKRNRCMYTVEETTVFTENNKYLDICFNNKKRLETSTLFSILAS